MSWVPPPLHSWTTSIDNYNDQTELTSLATHYTDYRADYLTPSPQAYFRVQIDGATASSAG